MRIFRRWRKSHINQRNTLVINASLIRIIVEDNVDFAVGGLLYDYLRDVSDDELDWLGGEILNDPIISYVVSLKFTQILEQGGLDE
jgi:hypothetical protein